MKGATCAANTGFSQGKRIHRWVDWGGGWLGWLAPAWQQIEKGTPRLGEFIREFESLVGRPRPLCLLLIGPVRIDFGTRHSLP